MTRSPVRKPTRRATPAPRPQTGMALHTLDGARKDPHVWTAPLVQEHRREN